jgi:hypothetical protein
MYWLPAEVLREGEARYFGHRGREDWCSIDLSGGLNRRDCALSTRARFINGEIQTPC